MKNTRTIAFVAAALVAGFVLGGVGLSLAGPSQIPLANSAYCQVGTGDLVTTLARLTGLSAQDIMSQRASGKSFADIATANGVDPATVVSQTLAARKAYLDGLVSAGRMTQAQEDANLSAISTRLNTMMTSTTAGTWGPGSYTPSSTPSVPTSGTPWYRCYWPYGPSRPASATPAPRRGYCAPRWTPTNRTTTTTYRQTSTARRATGTSTSRTRSTWSGGSRSSYSGSRSGYCGGRSGGSSSGGSRSSGSGSRSGSGWGGCGW